MRRVFTSLLVAGTLLSLATTSRATLIGSLTNRFGDNTEYYQYTNNGGPDVPPAFGTVGSFTTTIANVPQDYKFNVPVPGFGPNSVVHVLLEQFSSVDAGPAFAIPATLTNQGQQNVSWRIVLDGAQGGYASGTLVLGIVPVGAANPIAPPTGTIQQVFGTGGTPVPPSFGGATAIAGGQDRFMFASDIYPTLLLPEGYTWTFSQPPVTPWPVNPVNGVLGNAQWGGDANFSAELLTPEPGVLGMLLCSGVAGSLFVLRRRRAA